jgi:hypothetical protein
MVRLANTVGSMMRARYPDSAIKEKIYVKLPSPGFKAYECWLELVYGLQR